MKEYLLYESKSSKIFLNEDQEKGLTYITKILNKEFPSAETIRQFYNEYELTHALKIEGIRKSFEKKRIHNHHVIVMEYIPGKPISEMVETEVFSIGDFLEYAIKISRILSEVHEAKIIHKDINSHNIIIDANSRKVTLLDFGISTKINLKKSSLDHPQKLEGSLMYISPEQSGRMNRVTDYRTDLYSLGITFFEMLTGQLPFQSTDAMELIYSHITSRIPSISNYRNNVPEMLEQIINKLTAKNAEARYQSALGLMRDLQICLDDWKKLGHIKEFEICQHDFSGDFHLPQKLYGRDKELGLLMKAFDHVSVGHVQTLLVGGYSGTGKSVLVHEIHRPITAKKGVFIEGKFDQFQRSVPYFAFIQAFTSFVSFKLTENKDQLEPLQKKMKNLFGDEGKILTDLIPNLKLLIGPQPEVPKLGGLESQNRLNYLFSSFMQAITTAEHPIVLFIDDMQWADSASLSLLSVLMTNKDLNHLMCICAYRDNEVNSTHPFITTVEDMRKKGALISEIKIGNLEERDVQQLISDATRLPMERTFSLANLVYEKTHGNAFFVTQFLKNLAEESLLHFNHKSREWQWNIEKIKDRNITDNVVDLLSKKIMLLPRETQDILKVAACIGNQFDLETLSTYHSLSNDSDETPEKMNDIIFKALQEALEIGYITPTGYGYRFIHDRIQQASYSLLSDTDRSTIHHKMGSFLLKKVSKEELENQLFTIVNQLNQGTEKIKSEEEKELLAELNLRAGIKAKDSSAFQPALAYFETGILLLRPDHWNSQYKLSINLFTEAAEIYYNMGKFNPMEEKLNIALENHKELLDVVRLYAIRINALKAQNKLQEAIDTGLEILNQLGEKFPAKGPLPIVMIDLIRTKINLLGKDKKFISNLPEMTDPYKSAALSILNNIASPVYWARPKILPFIIFRMVRLSLKYGVTEISAFGFATYGLLMCGVLGDMRSGYQFGQIGLSLLDRFEAKQWLSQIYTPIYALINHWSEHVHKSLEPFLYSYKVGFETGAIEYACINVNIYCNHIYLGGKHLHECEKKMKMFSEQMLKYKQETNYNYNEVYRQAVLNLQGLSENPTILSGKAYDEYKMAPIHEERKDRAGTFLIHINNLMLKYLFHQYDNAIEHAIMGRPLLDAVLAKYDVAIFWYYEGLSSMALARESSGSKKRNFLRRARKNIKQFRNWARYCPANHQHKLDLLIAEMAWCEGKGETARKHFDLAIKGAENGEFLNEEALSLERAGLYYLSADYNFIAENYLRKAYQTYKEWGAKAKVQDMRIRFPKILIGFDNEIENVKSKTRTEIVSLTENNKLDLNTLMKAAQAISKEIVQERLLETLLNISIKNAGAESGCIIMKKGKDWFIKSSYFAEQNDLPTNIETPFNENKQVPKTVIEYIYNTQLNLVLDDISQDPRFMSDSIVKERQLKSVMCLPMFSKGKTEGVLYLENNLQASVFTENRVRFLELLSGQIAVSLENAQLYEDLEQKIEERTSSLKASLENLKATQAQLIQSEKMASLGELTAGIAHEIQNPLNFVNNFSEVSTELLEEMEHEMDLGDIEEAKALASDIRSNLEKINTHGKRADAIVKGMLQHSRSNSGQKEVTDINALCDEFLRLSFHGIRAKDKDFNAVFETHLDPSLPKIKVVPQDIGRVILNLINNAFYAVNEKNKKSNLLSLDERSTEIKIENVEYVPKVTVSTKNLDQTIEITVHDNGFGIPDAIKDKIFQPFFTTKPTGQGTGLGLSLSYDIVKAHGGEINIEKNLAGGSTFVISLPKNNIL